MLHNENNHKNTISIIFSYIGKNGALKSLSIAMSSLALKYKVQNLGFMSHFQKIRSYQETPSLTPTHFHEMDSNPRGQRRGQSNEKPNIILLSLSL